MKTSNEEYQDWLAEYKEDEAVEKHFEEYRSTDNKAVEFLKGERQK